MKRKICVVTGTRAEYGLLYWIIKCIHEDPELELQLIVTGMHLSPEFGFTVKEIEKMDSRLLIGLKCCFPQTVRMRLQHQWGSG